MGNSLPRISSYRRQSPSQGVDAREGGRFGERGLLLRDLGVTGAYHTPRREPYLQLSRRGCVLLWGYYTAMHRYVQVFAVYAYLGLVEAALPFLAMVPHSSFLPFCSLLICDI